jgi:hypothetical protein
MKIWIPLLIAAAVGCAPPSSRSSYDWKGYDDNLYALMKNPNGMEAYGINLKKQIDRSPDGKRLAPGICAEYGYVLLVAGRKAEAVDYFNREKVRWPESTTIMDRMIANCAPLSVPAAPQATATTPVQRVP